MRRTVVLTLAALYRRIALDWPSVPAGLLLPKVRVPKGRITTSTMSTTSSPFLGTASPPSHVGKKCVSREAHPTDAFNRDTLIMATPTSRIHYGPAKLQVIAPRRKMVPVSSPALQRDDNDDDDDDAAPAPDVPMRRLLQPQSPSSPPVSRKLHRATHGLPTPSFHSNPPSPPLTPECVRSVPDGKRDHRHNHNLNHHHHRHNLRPSNKPDSNYTSHYDSDSDHSNHNRNHDADADADETAAHMGMAVAISINSSVPNAFCPAAITLQVSRGRSAGDNDSDNDNDNDSCTSCGHRWRQPAPILLKDGFRLTDRFLAKSHCRPRAGGHAEFGCVLCTSRGRTARYASGAALGAHINEEHSKWQMLHDRDLL